MSIAINVFNATPFTLSIVGSYGSSWEFDFLANSVAPGGWATVAALTVPGVLSTNYGWLYLQHDEFPPRALQLFASASVSVTSLSFSGAIGLKVLPSSQGDPMPRGGTPAMADPGPETGTFTATLTYVFRGLETGVSYLSQQLDLPCSFGTYLDVDAQDTTLFLFGATPRTQYVPVPYWVKCALPALPAASDDLEAAVQATTVWTAPDVPFAPAGFTAVGDFSGLSCLSRGGLANADQSLFYLWNQADYSGGQVSWRFLSAEYSKRGDDPLSWTTVVMQDANNNPIGSGGFNCGQYAVTSTWFTPDVAAMTVGNGTVIVGMILPDQTPGQAATLNIYRYDHGKISQDLSGFEWPATSVQSFPIGQIATPVGFGTDVGLGLSMDWYDTTEGGTLRTWLVVAIANLTGTYNGLLIVETNADLSIATSSPPAVMTANAANMGATSAPVVQRDASGRVWVFWNESGADGRENLVSMTIPNTVLPDTLDFEALKVRTPAVVSGRTVSPFWWMNGSNGTTVAPVDHEIAQGTLPANVTSATRYPIYQFTGYGRLPWRCTVQLVGWGEEVTGVTGSPTPRDANTILVQGIIDGPVPIPNINGEIQVVQHTNFNDPLNTVTYGIQTDTQSSYQTQSSTGWGIKSSASFTVGWGPAWDIAVSRNTTQTFGTVTATATQTTLSLNTAIDSYGHVNPLGRFFACEATVTASRFQLLVPDPTRTVPDQAAAVPATDANCFLAFSVSFEPSTSYDFVPYATVPGDLHSYTAEEITARMKAPPFNWTGENYVKEVLAPLALPGVQIAPQWSEGGITGLGSATASKQSFVEQAWSLNESYYAGLSGGFSLSGGEGGVSFGFVSFQVSVMGGLLLSRSKTTSTTSTDGWQIEITGSGLLGSTAELQTPPATNCSEYDFTMYFLPASPLWSDELIKGLGVPWPAHTAALPLDPARIDPGSAPWRIAFVVTKIVEWVGDVVTQTYPPLAADGSADPGTGPSAAT